jgi:type IV pilus assembly protein PilM
VDPFVKSRGEEIGVGVERAGAFLASASRDAGQIQRVYCSGGGARIPGLADALSERLRLTVEVADPLKGLRVKDEAFGSLAVDEVAPLLMLAVGLALRKLN